MGQLTWHNDLIPYNEVWIKIGGDKGGTSFKASFQLVNTNRANSVTNTCVFTVFEAGDSISNLHIALSRYSSEIETLSLSKWRYMYNKKCRLNFQRQADTHIYIR